MTENSLSQNVERLRLTLGLMPGERHTLITDFGFIVGNPSFLDEGDEDGIVVAVTSAVIRPFATPDQPVEVPALMLFTSQIRAFALGEWPMPKPGDVAISVLG